MTDALLLQIGVLTTAQLAAHGWSKWAVEREVARGALQRIRPGWFALHADSAALAAVQAGGCVSCFSALALRGVWVPEGLRDHVRVAPHRRRRSPLRCHPYGANPAVHAAVDSVEVAVRCAARCGTAEQLIVVLDSILNRRIATEADIRGWLSSAPARIRELIDRCDGRSESGTESMARLRLRALGIACTPQVWLARGVRVDLLIGDRLVIECDGRAHHSDAAAYEADRARDRMLAALGYHVIRLSYRQIVDDWPRVCADIAAIVRRGGHRWPRARRNHD